MSSFDPVEWKAGKLVVSIRPGRVCRARLSVKCTLCDAVDWSGNHQTEAEAAQAAGEIVEMERDHECGTSNYAPRGLYP